MKWTILAILTLGLPGSALAQVTDENDRFTGERKIKYESQTKYPLGQPSRHARIIVKGGSATGAATFIIGNMADRRTGTAWKYLRCNRVDWLINGAPADFGEAIHSGQVVRGGVIEIISVPMSPDQIERIGSAATVEFRICNDEYQLSAEDIAGFRRVAEIYGEKVMPEGLGQPPAATNADWQKWKN